LYWNASASPAAWNVGSSKITLGQNAGQTGQGTNAIALGQQAGQTNQGNNAVAIGYRAGQTGQHANSIVINASGSALNTGTTGTCFVAPIRNPNTSYDNFLNYDAITKEVVYNYFMLPVGGTTGPNGRPSPAVTGMMRYNTTTGFPEFYNGTNWLSFSVGTQATLTVSGLSSSTRYVNQANGIISSPIQGGYTIYEFNSVGTGTVTPNFTGNVEYLVIGGGGGGGSGDTSSYGGGGGAGGYRTNYGGVGFPISSGTAYTVTVGNRGLFTSSSDNANGTQGTSSTFSTINSSGGGYGAGSGGNLGGSGGSGGGGAYIGTTGGAGNAGGYSPVEGYSGGNYNTGGQGAPGGSASSAGSNTSEVPTSGASNNIAGGSAIIYAYGGGGNPTQPIYTTPGSGGNGGRVNPNQPGNNGTIGIVVIRFPSYF
jgi:hypothetical protein